MPATVPAASSGDEAFAFGLDPAMALPRQRIERWLEQIEAQCRRTQASIEKEWPALQAKVDAARRAYEAIDVQSKASGAPPNNRKKRSAMRAYCDASNALRPPLWWLSQEGLKNANLVREGLASNNAAEAVEAALRAMNAVWKLQSTAFEKPIAAALKGFGSWQKGGHKKADLQRTALARRNREIAKARASIIAGGERSKPTIARMLSDRFNLSIKQIHRILASLDMS